jgi:hypothetical protein
MSIVLVLETSTLFFIYLSGIRKRLRSPPDYLIVEIYAVVEPSQKIHPQ